MWFDFPKPPAEPRPHAAIFETLGVAGVQRLIRAFYTEIGRSSIAHLFPQDPEELMKAADNNALFWVTMVGGPPLYEEKHGKPMMRQRHFRFPVTGEARAVWLACWEPVLAEAPRSLGFPAEHIEGFRAWITTFSAYIVNTKSPVDEEAEAGARPADEKDQVSGPLRFRPSPSSAHRGLKPLP
ncbi:MAG TPA: hypothetical protein VMV83_14770 [Rectinemataceae bacterium]|nr:hypothetical protein [Rectinemataceae bacterium]